MHDTLIVNDEIFVSFEKIDFDYVVVVNDAGSLEKALTINGEQARDDDIMPVIINGQIWLYQDSNQ